jgi:hemerythrin-like domain-containing protein
MLTRRTFATAGLATIAAAATACKRGDSGDDEPDVKPTEDLMREHGVLARLMLVLESCAPRLDESQSARTAIAAAARLVRDFVEDYHEALEEQHLFPRFQRNNVHAELVDTLLVQHRAGRMQIDALLASGAFDDTTARDRARHAIDAFIRMYRPHAAREDTVLFVDLPRVASGAEIAELGERFEREERQRFGERGFVGIVAQVAGIERSLGIDDLARFTPSQS